MTRLPRGSKLASEWLHLKYLHTAAVPPSPRLLYTQTSTHSAYKCQKEWSHMTNGHWTACGSGSFESLGTRK